MSDVQTETSDASQSSTETVQQETHAAPDTSWVPKRISEITAARRAAEQRAADAEAELARFRSGQTSAPSSDAAPSNQSVEQLAKAYAERMVRDQSEQSTMNTKIAAINEAGAKEYGDDYEKSCQNLSMAGLGGPDFLKVLTNVPKAEALVTWLGKTENLNDAMRIASMDPIQMGIELTKMSGKAAKDLGKQVSKAPPPIETLSGGGGSDGSAPDPKDTQAWMKWRSQTKKSRR